MNETEFCTALEAELNATQPMQSVAVGAGLSDLFAKLTASGISLNKILALVQAVKSKDITKIIAALLDLIPPPQPTPEPAA